MKREQFEVIAKFKDLVIPHPQYLAAFDQVKQAFDLNDQVGFQQNLICIGLSGTGKSTLKRKIYELCPSRLTDERRLTPILVIDTPSLPTVKNMAEEVLLQLGDSKFNKGSAIEKTVRILDHMRRCEVKLMIFDELQHFIDHGNKTTPKQVSDWLKSLIEQSGVSTVLMGLTQSEHILRINEQLRRRFSSRVDLLPFSIADQESFWIFFKALRALDKVLKLPQAMDLSEDLVHRFHFATNGIIGYMVNLTIAAYQVACENNLPCVERKCLERAFTASIWSKGVGVLNPFSPKFNNKPLIEVGMPFHTPLARNISK